MRNLRLLFVPTIWAFTLFLIFPPAKAAETARITQAVDDGNRVTLPGNVHPLARFENDRGLAPDSQPVRRILLLLQRAPEQELALRKLMDEQQTKSSPNYHQWLTPEQLGQQFGPADPDIQAVNDWLLRGAGIVSAHLWLAHRNISIQKSFGAAMERLTETAPALSARRRRCSTAGGAAS